MRLVIAFVFVACIATIGGCFLMRGSDGVLDASWTAPTTNVDGSPLTDVVSYRVYYSTTNPPCPSGPFLTVPSSTARPALDQKVKVRLTGLIMGQLYYVAIAAVNSHGVLSACTPAASARSRRP
jgi:fibronectin type III domain protein